MQILADISAAEMDADPGPGLAELAGCSALIALGSGEAGPVESEAAAEAAAGTGGDYGGGADPEREAGWPCAPRTPLRASGREPVLSGLPPDPDAEQPPSLPGSPVLAAGRPAADSPGPATADPPPDHCGAARSAGAELVSGVPAALLAVFLRGARRPGGELDWLAARVAGAHALSSAGSAWFTRCACGVGVPPAPPPRPPPLFRPVAADTWRSHGAVAFGLEYHRAARRVRGECARRIPSFPAALAPPRTLVDRGRAPS